MMLGRRDTDGGGEERWPAAIRRKFLARFWHWPDESPEIIIELPPRRRKCTRIWPNITERGAIRRQNRRNGNGFSRLRHGERIHGFSLRYDPLDLGSFHRTAAMTIPRSPNGRRRGTYRVLARGTAGKVGGEAGRDSAARFRSLRGGDIHAGGRAVACGPRTSARRGLDA